jgi:hypothetical protein
MTTGRATAVSVCARAVRRGAVVAAARAAVRTAAPAVALTATLAASPVFAQAWVPPARQGTVTVAFQVIENTGHLLTDGSTVPQGRSRDASVYLEADYAITDRFSVVAGVPFVFAKYLGPPPPPGIPEPPMVRDVDKCYCWQQAWADFGLTARYNLFNGAAALTPSVSYGLPSHDYAYRGEAVVGRHLKEIRLAVDAGLRLDAISPRLALQGRYSYAWVEQVLDVPNNRSNVTAEALFQATNRLQVRGGAYRQITHGGLRLGTEGPTLPDGYPWGEAATSELFAEHDRLLRDNYWHLGAGFSFSFAWADVFASYVEFVSGTDTHAGRAFTAGLSVPFGLPHP